MALIDIKVPDIGDFDEVAVIELLVKVGDVVKAEQSLITVESDKASMEIPCSHAGVVKALKVKLGDMVKQGSVVLVLEGEATASAGNARNSDKHSRCGACCSLFCSSLCSQHSKRCCLQWLSRHGVRFTRFGCGAWGVFSSL